MDLIILRENTEGFYADRNMFEGSGEFSPSPGIGLAFMKANPIPGDGLNSPLPSNIFRSA